MEISRLKSTPKKTIYELDNDGFIQYQSIVDESFTLQENMTDIPCDEAIKFPKFDKVNQKWVDDLEKNKERKKSELDQSCTKTILGRFKVMLNEIEYEFSYDEKAQSRFNGTGVLFLGNKITEIPWTAYVNGERVRINLTNDDFDIVSMAALNHLNSNVIRYNELLQDVDNASIDELNEIKW